MSFPNLDLRVQLGGYITFVERFVAVKESIIHIAAMTILQNEYLGAVYLFLLVRCG